MTIIGDGKRFTETKFSLESEFEEDIVSVSNTLFGDNIVFINPKKKLESKSLGGTIPDGFFFDFNDPTDPQFYIVEVELVTHNFFGHVFPQVTKFFAFYKNIKLQKSLVDKLFTIIDQDKDLRVAFKRFLGKREIYKFLSDVIETSQNILLIADGTFKELQEITDTYTDTWGKLVKYLEIRKYVSEKNVIYTITPDFDTIQYIEPSIDVDEVPEEGFSYSEDFHLEDIAESTRKIYQRIKEIALEKNGQLVFNPQKYYISIRKDKNIAFLQIRKKKVRFIAMLPEEQIRTIVKHYSVATLSQGVQNFYNGPCAAIDFIDLSHEAELINLINTLIETHISDE
ncbi:MAG: hypothetical protein JXA13_17230 [Anaerolineales bacterium]|nr:hypothetical protein [Anaerolineales bacterium]